YPPAALLRTESSTLRSPIEPAAPGFRVDVSLRRAFEPDTPAGPDGIDAGGALEHAAASERQASQWSRHEGPQPRPRADVQPRTTDAQRGKRRADVGTERRSVTNPHRAADVESGGRHTGRENGRLAAAVEIVAGGAQ